MPLKDKMIMEGFNRVRVASGHPHPVEALHDHLHLHLQRCGVHEHRPHSDVAVGANAHNLHHWRLTRHHHQSQVHLGAEGLEVIELVAERLPLLGLDLCQSDKGVDNQENMECSYLLSMKMRTV